MASIRSAGMPSSVLRSRAASSLSVITRSARLTVGIAKRCMARTDAGVLHCSGARSQMVSCNVTSHLTPGTFTGPPLAGECTTSSRRASATGGRTPS
jgi:hypothetical protein